jgi:hypothetical protein
MRNCSSQDHNGLRLPAQREPPRLLQEDMPPVCETLTNGCFLLKTSQDYQ